MMANEAQTIDSPAPLPAKPLKPSGLRRIGGVLLGIGVLCVVAVGIWQSIVYLGVVEGHLQHNKEQIDKQAKGLESLENAFQVEKKQQQEQVRLLQSKIDALSAQLLSGEVELPLRLFETEHLVRMADYRLTFLQDPKMALQLLTSANKGLDQFTDSTLNPLKERLSGAMLELQKMKQADAVEISLKINQAVDVLSSIPVTPAKRAIPAPPPVSSLPNWQQGVQQAWEKLKSLVVIRQVNTSIKPFLLPEEHALVLWNIRLELEQAKLAAWRGEGNAYGVSLQQATLWTKQNLNVQDPSTHSVLKMLEALSSIRWAAPKPNLAELAALIHKTLTEVQAKKR